MSLFDLKGSYLETEMTIENFKSLTRLTVFWRLVIELHEKICKRSLLIFDMVMVHVFQYKV